MSLRSTGFLYIYRLPVSDLTNKFIAVVAQKLGETEPTPIAQIRRLVERLGAAKVVELVQDARAIQRNGGVLTLSADRKRTTGGIFFLLSRGYLTKADARYVFPRVTTPPCDEQEGVVIVSKMDAITVSGNETIIASADHMSSRMLYEKTTSSTHPQLR